MSWGRRINSVTAVQHYGVYIIVLVWVVVVLQEGEGKVKRLICHQSAWPGRPEAFLLHGAALIRGTNIAPVPD